MSRSNWESRLPGHCPVTWAVLGANAVTFVATFVTGARIWNPLVFRTAGLSERPWTVVTYPLVSDGQILWLLIGGYFFWVFGGSLERAWGRRDYIVFLTLVTVSAALGLWLGGALLARVAFLSGLWLPLASALAAWSVVNPAERLLMYFVVPMQARWLGIISAVLVFFSFPFPLGLFALAGPGIAWWYVREGRYRLSRTGGAVPRRGSSSPLSLNPLTMIRRWRMKRQFKTLMKRARMEGSGEQERH